MHPIILIRNLSYTYPNGTKALNNVNIDIFRNESVAIIGQNGGGKTTLLLHLNGIIENKEGSIEILGMPVNKKNIKIIRSKVGIVFQNPDDQLFMPTVFDDVAFGPISMGLSESEVKERVNSALKKVGMLGFEDRFSHHLSLGEKKKVSLATVLSMNPEIIVLDEPMANLDPKSRRDLIKIIRELKTDGKTIIISTHDLNTLPELVDRVYVLNKTIILCGTPRDIFLNTSLLETENLDIPNISLVFDLLSYFGYDTKNIPLSIENAIRHLINTNGARK